GVPITRIEPLRHRPSPYNRHYLVAKSRSGHALATSPRSRRAPLPEKLEAFAPRPVAGAPGLVHMATYLLPIRVGVAARRPPPAWFRCHVYFDTRRGGERVLLEYRQRRERVPLLRLQSESLLERFPSHARDVNRRGWRAAARAIVRHGAGYAMFG